MQERDIGHPWPPFRGPFTELHKEVGQNLDFYAQSTKMLIIIRATARRKNNL